jgi:hypothetical protein
MSNPTSNFNWQMPTNTDLVSQLPADFEVFGQAVDTSLADLKGGTTGQILAKNSNTDMDFVWTTAAPGDITAVNVTSPITGGGSSGDVTIGIASSAVVPSQSGQSGKYLTTDGTTSSWGTVSTASTLSLIASGTASGASLTISGLSSYDTIRVLIFEMNSSATGQLTARINNNSTSNYWASAIVQNAGTTQLHFINAADGIKSYNNMTSGATNGNVAFTFTNCKAAGFTNFDAQSTYRTTAPANEMYRYEGTFEVNAAVSSLVFTCGGNWSGTTNYRVYGA